VKIWNIQKCLYVCRADDIHEDSFSLQTELPGERFRKAIPSFMLFLQQRLAILFFL
jgi:hypothetical protein